MIPDGSFDITLHSPIGRQRATLEFKSRGTRLSGSMTGSMGVISFDDGIVDGGNLRWTMRGVINSTYSDKATWECTAKVDGDQVTGEANIAKLGAAAFHGSRVGSAKAREEAASPTIPWTDLGLPRYEAISADWVKALNAWVEKQTKGKKVDFELTWSVQYTDPPAHLLRGHGPNVVGFHYRVKDRKVVVLDGPLADADVHTTYSYHPFAVNLKMTTDQYVVWVKENGDRYKAQVQNTGDLSKFKLMSELMAGEGNSIREDFWSQQTR